MLHEQSSALHWSILIGTQSLVLCIKKNLLNILLSAILLYYHFTATLLEKVVCSLPLLHHLPFSHLISSQQTFCSTIDRDCTLRSPMICMFSHLTVIFLFSSLQTCQQHGIILSSWKATLFLALRYFTLLFFPLSLLAIFFFFSDYSLSDLSIEKPQSLELGFLLFFINTLSVGDFIQFRGFKEYPYFRLF